MQWRLAPPWTSLATRGTYGETPILNALVVVLLALWLLGLVSAYTMGGLIHVLLVIAIIVGLLRVIQGRRPV